MQILRAEAAATTTVAKSNDVTVVVFARDKPSVIHVLVDFATVNAEGIRFEGRN